MKTRFRISPALLAVWLLAAFAALPAQAADDFETNGPDGLLYGRFWVPGAFPLHWRLHNAGVVNNQNVVAGTPDVSNADAQAQLTTALTQWTGVGTATLSNVFDPETPTGTSGADGINIITWSDDSDFAGSPTVIARGINVAYAGADVVVTAANRSNLVGGITLDSIIYPDGSTLRTGTIVDSDLSFNAVNFDYETVPASVASVADIQSIAVHEFGHCLGLCHVSLQTPDSSTRPTMFPSTSTANATTETNIRTVELDDRVSISRLYPGAGFWPTGSAAFTTGAVSGQVTQLDGTPVSGIRAWAFDAAAPTVPLVEVYTTAANDANLAVTAGSYIIPGLPPGNYFIAIQPWLNGVPSAALDDPTGGRYNRTAIGGGAVPAFNSEAYDDFVSAGTGFPNLSGAQKVTVTAGQTKSGIDFVLGAQNIDVMLVMDRSGSMGGGSGHPGVTKIEALQNAANEFIDFLELDAGHKVGLVQFAENLVPFPAPFDLQPLTAASRPNAHAAIADISAGGFTNIIAGINEAIAQLTTAANPNPRQTIVLFSDGKHNRPVGSNLLDIHDPVVDNDLKFFSIGFGTDVDDAILSQVAADSGGVHVNEQDMDPLALQKHFITIASSAVDSSLLIDPRLSLPARGKAEIKVTVTGEDKNLTFAANFLSATPDGVRVHVIGPDGLTRIPAAAQGPGWRRVRGKTYELVRVNLPIAIQGKKFSKGVWTLVIETRAKAEANLLAVGKSDTVLAVNLDQRNPQRPIIEARVVRRGKPLPRAKLAVELYRSEAPASKSEEDDERGGKTAAVSPARPSKRVATIPLKPVPKDSRKPHLGGLHAAELRVEKPGVYFWRLVAQWPEGGATARRETSGTLPLTSK
ncbi:MAG TPA: VWA domain-containing protein [Chthoniobacterales bacterium]|nr:VWA domain-containing protein [Chthoniobacterales bacterium]